MQKHYNYLNIDLDKKIHTKLKAKQWDSKSRYILVNLISNSTYYNLTGTTVKIYGIKKDKTIFFNNATVTDAKNGQFEIELTNQALAVVGEIEIQILILGTDDEKLTTFSFFIDVNKTIIDDTAIESTNEFTALTTALSSVQNIDNRFAEVDEQFNTNMNEINNKLNLKVEIDDSNETQVKTYSSAKIAALINTIPKGDKGEPGTASIAINDDVTNTSQTWTSSKINKNITKACYLRGFSLTYKKTGTTLTLNFKKFGLTNKLYIIDCNGNYRSTDLLSSYVLEKNQALVFDTDTSLVEVYDITNTSIKNKMIVWLNIDGYLVYDATKEIRDSNLKFCYYRDGLNVGFKDNTYTLNFTGLKRLYYYISGEDYYISYFQDTYTLSHNECMIFDYVTGNISIKNITTDKLLNDETILLFNIDGEIVDGKLKHLVEKKLNNEKLGDKGEYKFFFDVNAYDSYISSHILIGDELWVFPVSNDEHSNYKKVQRHLIDFTNNTQSLVGEFEHNWGHVNSISYNKITDSIITGSGITSYTGAGEILIFENASNFKNLDRVDYEQAIKINVASFGNKLNVVWGDSNNGTANICYCITNDNKNIRKVLLGQGSTQLENGNFIDGKTGLQFNGTYKVLEEYYQKDGNDVNQGTCFIGGSLYIGLGHDTLWYTKNKLHSNGTISKETIKEYFYDYLGDKIEYNTQGITVTDTHIIVGLQNIYGVNRINIYSK